MEKKFTKYTTYQIATKWLNMNLVLCNNLPNIDDELYGNMRFDYWDVKGECTIDIYQWYLTNLTESDVEWLENNFDLKFTYSDVLDCFVLCVDHWGTRWGSVECGCSDEWLEHNPDCEYVDSCNPPEMILKREIVKKG